MVVEGGWLHCFVQLLCVMVIFVVKLCLMCASSIAHLIILGNMSRVIIWVYPHPSIEWRRLGLGAKDYMSVIWGSGHMTIAWDM